MHPFRALAALAALLCAVDASAQRTSYDLERLALDPSATGSLVLGTGEVLAPEAVRFSLAAHWERAPLVLSADGDLRGRGLFWARTNDRNVVTDRFTGHVGVAFGILNGLEFGLRVPYIADQRGDALDTAGYPQLRSDNLSMASAMLRYGVHSQNEGMPISVAVAVEAGLPFTRGKDVDGTPGDVISPRVEVGHSYGKFLVAADVGANLRLQEVTLSNGEKLSHEVLAGIVAATTGRPLRLEASLRGAFNFDGVSQSAELLAGARYAFASWGEAFAIAGPGFMEAPGTPTFRALLGVALARSGVARAAPVAAAPAPAPVAKPAPVDPCAPGQSHRPEQCPALDDDGDGIANASDRCPAEKGVAGNQGCPAVDSDGDGLADNDDKCPQVKGEAKDQGCPPPDRDGDGVADAADKCPDQPGVPDEQGCPPKRAAVKVDEKTGETKIAITEKVFFDTGKSTIQERSFPLLDDVAKLIAANPKMGKISVEGHTDDRGPAELNRQLSLDRADAVKKYLAGKGVEPVRLEAKGFGPDRPAQPNTTAKGRDANRRVEFLVVPATK